MHGTPGKIRPRTSVFRTIPYNVNSLACSQPLRETNTIILYYAYIIEQVWLTDIILLRMRILTI